MPSFGAVWHHLPICNSTNDEAQRLGRAGAAEGTVVTADEQRAGRGRLGRHWHSPAGENLYLSVLLRPPFLPQRAPLLSLCAGLALHQAASTILAASTGTNFGDGQRPRLLLKWPNDLLGARSMPEDDAPYRKLGGVLTELVCAGSSIDFVVVGIGCNIHGTTFPAEISATSLQLLTGLADTPGANLKARHLGQQLLAAFEGWYQRYLQQGPEPIVEAFAAAANLGPQHPPIQVSTSCGILHGVPVGLGVQGDLLVRRADGTLECVRSGDVGLIAPPTPLSTTKAHEITTAHRPKLGAASND